MSESNPQAVEQRRERISRYGTRSESRKPAASGSRRQRLRLFTHSAKSSQSVSYPMGICQAFAVSTRLFP